MTEQCPYGNYQSDSARLLHEISKTMQPGVYEGLGAAATAGAVYCVDGEPVLQRAYVPPEYVDWSVEYPDYDPPELTSDWVLTTGVELGVSDPEDPREVDFTTRPSFMGKYDFDDQKRPRNPRGRQGIAGRGDLAKHGVNNAADPIVVATDPGTGTRKLLLIRRGDTRQWALPGGMVDPGEQISRTAARELGEEAGIDVGDLQGEVVYEGYVDDPRKTDNAWIETTARLFRLSHAVAPQAGDDAVDARWFSFGSMDELRDEIRQLDNLDPSVEPLYASHSETIAAALEHL